MTDAIRPFRINVPDETLVDLRRCIRATRWLEPETVTDESQGVQLAILQEVAPCWQADYDWRKCDEKLSPPPQFMTEIDGLGIHLIFVRSTQDYTLPLIVTHGWPSCFIEQLKIVDPLTNPTAHDASASDAFHLAILSLPGHGISAKPSTAGWRSGRIVRARLRVARRVSLSPTSSSIDEVPATRN